MDNAELASLLDEWADILDMEGESRYRSRAYRTAAHRIATLAEPVQGWVRQGRDLRAIPGIGDALSARIRMVVAQGWPELEEARKRHGLGPRTTLTEKAEAKARRPSSGLASHLKGDLHAHTEATDGRDSIEDMARAARRRGYEYIAITDHSKETRVAGGLDDEAMRAHMGRIRRLDGRIDGITVLAGAEVDILRDGRLDLPDGLLGDLDVVVCSVHFRHKMDGKRQTERILTGMSNDHADILAHPTGRRTGIRPGMDIDLDRIAEAAAGQGWAIEMNGSPERRDLDAAGASLCARRGVLLSLDSDAHSVGEFDNIRNCAREAEKAGLGPEQVLNARGLDELRKVLRSG